MKTKKLLTREDICKLSTKQLRNKLAEMQAAIAQWERYDGGSGPPEHFAEYDERLSEAQRIERQVRRVPAPSEAQRIERPVQRR